MNIPFGQGHGEAGRYAGLADPYGSEHFAKIILLPVPFDQTTTYQKGSNKGPEVLIEASRNMELYDIETDSQVYQKGIYTAPAIHAQTSAKMLELTYNQTKKYLSQDRFVVVIGGEHSISYAPVRAYAEHYKQLTVLQFDAHADLQSAYENNPWSHASAVARIKEIPEVKKVVSVGIRSMSQEELPFVDRPHMFFAHEIEKNPNWIDSVLDVLSGPIYITIDLDVFDCSLMPSTGTPEPGGLNWTQMLDILRRVAQEKTLVGFDVVELCPRACNPAPDYLAAKLIYKLLSYKFLQEK